MTAAWRALTRQYLQARVSRHSISRTSRVSYGYVLDSLAGHMDTRRVPLNARGEEIVTQIDAWMASKLWSPTTCATNLGIVRPFLDWAAIRGIVTDGVTRELRNPRLPRTLPRAQSSEQVARLLAHVPDARGRAVVLLMAQCGLRACEVARLTIPEVDLADGALLIRGKGGSERMVYMSEETTEAVRAWMVARGPVAGHLISSHTEPGARMTAHWIGKLVAGWMADAGLKSFPSDGVSGHALRHTAATAMLRGGANIRVVQEALGHANITTTARYLRADDKEVRAAMAGLSYGTRRLRAVTLADSS